jgi:hypothetical protein
LAGPFDTLSEQIGVDRGAAVRDGGIWWQQQRNKQNSAGGQRL